MARAKESQKFIDKFAKKAFGRSLAKAEEKQVCIFVAKKSKCLAPGMSYLREKYKISGICQKVPG